MGALLKAAKTQELVPNKNAGEEMILEAEAWLTKIYEGPYQAALKIRQLLPEDVWERYAKWNIFEGHREVILWNTASAALRKAIKKNRPKLFKKVKNEDNEAR